MLRTIAVIWVFAAAALCCTTAQAQLSDPRANPYGTSNTPTLEEQLVNTLRATTEDRKAFIHLVVQYVDAGTLDRRMVVAIQRYAQRKNPSFPFPYFERAMRFEAEKLGITLPPVRLLAGAPSTYLSGP